MVRRNWGSPDGIGGILRQNWGSIGRIGVALPEKNKTSVKTRQNRVCSRIMMSASYPKRKTGITKQLTQGKPRTPMHQVLRSALSNATFWTADVSLEGAMWYFFRRLKEEDQIKEEPTADQWAISFSHLYEWSAVESFKEAELRKVYNAKIVGMSQEEKAAMTEEEKATYPHHGAKTTKGALGDLTTQVPPQY